MALVYCLASAAAGRTYVGCTTDLARRLRQHRGERTGGARATRRARDWSLVYIVRGLPTRRAALQLEWRLHRLGRRVARQGRVRQLHAALSMARWTATAPDAPALVAATGGLVVDLYGGGGGADDEAPGPWPAHVTLRRV